METSIIILLDFWAPHIKLDLLTLKMAFFFCFGASRRHSRCLKIGEFGPILGLIFGWIFGRIFKSIESPPRALDLWVQRPVEHRQQREEDEAEEGRDDAAHQTPLAHLDSLSVACSDIQGLHLTFKTVNQ